MNAVEGMVVPTVKSGNMHSLVIFQDVVLSIPY